MSQALSEAAAKELACYPIGRFHRPESVSAEALMKAITTLTEFPARLEEAVSGLTDEQLDSTYREGGWTLRQVVHHVADSHMNAFIRIRLALTEDNPTIKTYEESAWATLADSSAPVEWSLTLIESLHARLVMLLKSLDDAEWERTFVHPENGSMTIRMTALTYAWHSRHHLAHITEKRAREDW
jgi:hypothetical protein